MKASKEVLNERQRKYKAKPESIAHRREYDRIRLLNPEVRARMRAYQQSPRGKEVARKASAKIRATEEYKRKAREYKKSDKYQKWRRNDMFKKQFGITLDDYDKMLESQKGLCAICGLKETFTMKGRTHSLAVDHDHVTGKIRGLLCRACNQMLGLGKDKITTLEGAIQYLKKYV